MHTRLEAATKKIELRSGAISKVLHLIQQQWMVEIES